MQNLESLGAVIEEKLEDTSMKNNESNEAHKKPTTDVTTPIDSPASANIYETTTILFTSNSRNDRPEDKDPHANSLNWYLPECDRENAYQLLSKRANGAYLVRPNLKQLNPKYILSLVHENQVKHILIEEDATGCFIKSNFSQDRQQHRLSSLGIYKR